MSGTLKRCTWGAARRGLRPSKMFGYVPFEITGTGTRAVGSPGGLEMYGVVFINKASVVGSGGSGWTNTDDSSTVVLTE